MFSVNLDSNKNIFIMKNPEILWKKRFISKFVKGALAIKDQQCSLSNGVRVYALESFIIHHLLFIVLIVCDYYISLDIQY